MRWLVLCSIFSLSVLSADIPSYSELLKAPKGLAKDYYIYRYASEKNPNKAELKELQKLIFRNSGKIKKLFESKVGVLKLPPECEGDIYA
ncbi:MAG: lytic transglycosylase domain-containing protein, partial [Campylobacter sp.]|nr:lytic transglycosylase domain-containing protein [Campylobacter sp.]